MIQFQLNIRQGASMQMSPSILDASPISFRIPHSGLVDVPNEFLIKPIRTRSTRKGDPERKNATSFPELIPDSAFRIHCVSNEFPSDRIRSQPNSTLDFRAIKTARNVSKQERQQQQQNPIKDLNSGFRIHYIFK